LRVDLSFARAGSRGSFDVLLQHDMELSNDHLRQSLVKIRTPSFSPDSARPPSRSPAVTQSSNGRSIKWVGKLECLFVPRKGGRERPLRGRWRFGRSRSSAGDGPRKTQDQPSEENGVGGTTLRFLGCGNSGLERRRLLKDI
jgi:hypothetical protein